VSLPLTRRVPVHSASQVSKLTFYNKKSTISSREIQTSVRLILPGELSKHAISEGTKADTKFLVVFQVGRSHRTGRSGEEVSFCKPCCLLFGCERRETSTSPLQGVSGLSSHRGRAGYCLRRSTRSLQRAPQDPQCSLPVDLG
jgi:hypothetical protein